MITAFVLIQGDADTLPEAAQRIADIEGVAEVYSCAGDVDLIAIVRVPEHGDLATLVPGAISKVPGVRGTVTHIAFRSYSRSDAESTFSIGLEGGLG
jgi:DNA-binding Lrp family transcriptional regulator